MKIRIGKKEIIHFIGIGGIGMSGLAQIMQFMNFKIQGSDLHRNKNTENCQKLRIKVFFSHNSKNISNATIIVKSSAIKKNNPEIIAAKKKNIPIYDRAEMLANIVSLKKNIVISGSHGKTTTTSILATLLNARDPGASYIIGGVVKNLGGHSFLGDGEFLVAEADESDGSFVELSPEVSLVTNIDDDHMNYYQTRRNLEENFLKFINRVPFYGFCVLNIDDEAINSLLEGVRRPYVTFALENTEAEFQAEIISNKSFGCEFYVTHSDDRSKKHKFFIHSSGKHNVYNALGAIAVAIKLGFSWEELQESLEKFKGVGRRLELIYSNDNVRIFDDYAHHPTEIKAVIESQKNKSKKLTVMFQPHRYTRTQEKWDDFASCFTGADQVLVLPIYSANEDIIEGVNSVNLVKDICLNKVNAHWIQNIEDMKQFINFEDDEIILCLGAGSISRQIRIFARELEE